MDGFAALAETALAELPAALSEAAFAEPVTLEAGWPGQRVLLVDLTAYRKVEA